MTHSRTPRQFTAFVLPCLLLGFLAVSKVRYDRDLSTTGAALDSARAFISRNAGQVDSALTAGDSLPARLLLDSKGDSVSLATLPSRGYAYIYLYRIDCPACGLIRPYLDSLPPFVRDSIAFVIYSRRRLSPAEFGDHHFTAAVDTVTPGPPLATGVPTLIRVRRDGRIVGVATGVPHAARLMDMYGLADARDVEQRVDRAKQQGVKAVSPND